MAFDGSGVFLRLRNWVADAAAGVKIRADFHDTEDDNFAAGLTNCITKDGQTTITQNIKWNSKRIVALADPIDPQDASTKAYADTKASLAGGSTFTGDVVLKEVTPVLTLDATSSGKNSILGQKTDKNRWEIVLGNASVESGSNAGSDFNLINYADDGTMIGAVLNGLRSTGLLTVKGDPTVALGISTQQYTEARAVAWANTRLPLTGGTITGNLQITGEIGASSNIFRFGAIGSSPGYIQWQGGSTYTLGSAGNIWHTSNLNPAAYVSNARLVIVGDWQVPYNGANGGPVTEPFNGGLVTGVSSLTIGGLYFVIQYMRFRQLQLQTTSWWTVAYG